MPSLFAITREVIKATDALEAADADAEPSASGRAGEPVARRTVWWHQIDDDDDEHEQSKDFESWHAMRDLRRSRLGLMNGRATEAVNLLQKLRSDLVLYAKDAC